MRRALFTLFLILGIFTVSYAQISVNFFEVPADWGIESVYWADADTGSGIPVNLGNPGGNQSWDYSYLDSTNEFSQTIVSRDSTPYGADFPNANMVMASDDLGQFGFEGPGFIYYSLTTNGLYLLGLGLEYSGMPFPVVFEEPMTWMELPLDYQDSWNNNLYMEIPFDSAGVEYRIDLTMNFDFTTDAWGQLLIPLGDFEALRVQNMIDVEVEVNIILFGIPIPIMTENFSYISYIWVSEYLNMATLVMSQQGETNPNFTVASSLAALVDLTPGDISLFASATNPPVQIPAGGGSFNYEVNILNNLSTQNVFDVWVGTFLPNGGYYGPILLRPNLGLPGMGSVFRAINQNVPGNAPAGTYYYAVFAGDQSQNIVQARSGFTFQKMGNDGISNGGDWDNFGWDQEAALSQPSEFVFNAPCPNPFNPTTAISYKLQAASDVNLTVYDVNGREVAKLAEGMMSAGEHSVVFDASGMSSGVYFAVLQTGEFKQTQKMLLVK